MRRILLPLGVVVVFLVGMAAPALAKPVTVTYHEKKATDTFHDVLPCIGDGDEQGTITTTENGVIHVTAAGIIEHDPNDPSDDEFIPPYHVTGTFTGTFSAVPDDPTLPTYTGHFTQWFGENSNAKTFASTFTFTIVGRGTDGSTIKFHETAHITIIGTRVVVEFDMPTCH